MAAAVLARGPAPYPRPRDGAPLRLAFVGQETFFEACALEEHSARLETTFVPFRQGADAERMRAAVEAFAPHVVACFRPEILPAGLFAHLRAAVVGFLTEPIPRTGGRRAHPDLRRRRADLAALDPGNVDRVVAFDPLIVETADEFVRVWRSLPLPVADRLFAPPASGLRPPLSRPAASPPAHASPASPRGARARPGILFVGRSTEHRESWLAQPKAELDVLHAAFGIGAAELERLVREHEIAVNLHNEPYPSFENRVCLHLAAGQLVVSEPLSPTHGLEPGIDYLEVATPAELVGVLRTATRFPSAYHRVRLRGRAKAEAYRASRVWPRLLADLDDDLRVFGTTRSAAV